jgi:hypothetical protein
MAAHSSLLVGMIVGLVVGIAASWGLFFGSLDRGAPLADIALNTLLKLERPALPDQRLHSAEADVRPPRSSFQHRFRDICRSLDGSKLL